MKEHLTTISRWTESSTPFAVATVIRTWGSSPRPVGSTMLISDNEEIAGSVSGGCVEGSVIKSAQPLIASGEGKRIHYGVTDDDAWAVGLSCGGKMQVYLERFLAFDEREKEQAAWAALKDVMESNKSCVLVTRIADGKTAHTVVLPDGTVKGQEIDGDLKTEAIRAYRERKSQVYESGENQYFLQVFPRRSQMLIIGAAHITTDLVKLAHFYNFESIVIDPRGAFVEKTQFEEAPDQLINEYPAEVLENYTLDPFTYAVILSHDPKIDDNALHILLRSDVGYIGALGSKKTHAKRVARLEKAGYTEEEIGRIRAPIGMDINAKTPREIALAVMGEIIQAKNAYL